MIRPYYETYSTYWPKGLLVLYSKSSLKQKQTDLVKVNRQNYELIRNEGTYDILINAAMPSKRFWAQQNPAKDFIETTQKTLKLVNDWNWKKLSKSAPYRPEASLLQFTVVIRQRQRN